MPIKTSIKKGAGELKKKKKDNESKRSTRPGTTNARVKGPQRTRSG